MHSVAVVERVGGEVDENHARPLPAAPGASGHHDERVGPHPTCCGEGHQEGDGAVRQQHHLSALPVSQPAGGSAHTFKTVFKHFNILPEKLMLLLSHLLLFRLQTSSTATLPL